jgi:glycosyltransferase involved in cell wall biosynthesis
MKPTKKGKILFIFKDIGNKFLLANRGEFPKLFYSYFQFKEKYLSNFKEINYLDLRKYNKFFFSKSDYFYHRFISRVVNQYDIVFATTDGIVELLANLRGKNFLRKDVKIVGIIMSFFDDKRRIDHLFELDHIITFTKINYHKLKEIGIEENKISFLKLGTDIEFYSTKNIVPEKGKYILSIGLDKNRDWDTLKKIALKLPDIKFKVIGNEKIKNYFRNVPNLEFLGNLPYLETKKKIMESAIIFLPTKKNSYFSGQTTLLNVSALKKICVMPYDKCFEGYDFDPSYFYPRSYDVNEIAKFLLKIYRKPTVFKDSLEYNHKLVLKRYNNYALADQIYKITNFFVPKKVLIVNNSLSEYPRNKNIYEALSKLVDVKIIKLSKKYKPYHKKVIINFLKIFKDLLVTKIPKDTDYVFVLFGDAEQLWSIWLLRKVKRYKYKIIFDPLISYYDTYMFNKPLPALKHPIKSKFLRKWLYIYEKLLFSLPDLVLIDTEANGRYIKNLLNLDIKFKKLLLCSYTKIFKATKLEENDFWYNAPLKVLWYGQHSRLHNMEILLDAIAHIKSNNISFTIIGGGLNDTIDNKIKCLENKKNITYTRLNTLLEISLEDLAKLIQEHHICLGGFGETEKAKNVVLNKEYEALASGRCLITVKGNKEFLKNNVNCILIAPNNYRELAEKIELLNNDRDLLKKIAYKGYKDYKKYCENNYEKVLQGIINT